MWRRRWRGEPGKNLDGTGRTPGAGSDQAFPDGVADQTGEDRKSTRLNSSHGYISYAVFCLKKKKDNKSHILAAYIHLGHRNVYVQVSIKLQSVTAHNTYVLYTIGYIAHAQGSSRRYYEGHR